MQLFPLEIFPSSALGSSVITTVWVGVMIMGFLNLRYGMTLSGLVVPGYLVPMLILKPVSAFVVIGEGFLTYWIALLCAEYMPKRLGFGEMFGRDRFFAIMLISVLVRTVLDGWWLPDLSSYLATRGYQYDFQTNLHSFGLVIIALVANQMWNGGFRVGVRSLTIYLLLTYIAVRWVLIPFTNFSISNIGAMYEDIAINVLASPKAYMILLATAFLASRMNLFYGWDFNGIIIPALIALQWYQPGKLVVTLIEALLILFASRAFLRIPYFADRNMEGARLIMLFFSISFAYKILIGFIFEVFFPEAKASDFFAFGYLLSTLMAVKMYQKEIAVRLMRTTLQTSVVAASAATLAGFALVVFFHHQSTRLEKSTTEQRASTDTDLLSELREQRVALYRSDQNTAVPYVSTTALDAFSRGLGALTKYHQDQEGSALQEAQEQFALADFELYSAPPAYWILRDKQPVRGAGLYVLNQKASNRLCVQVPRVLGYGSLAESAASLYKSEDYYALAFSGIRADADSDPQRDVTRNAGTFFHRFHQFCSAGGVLQIIRSDKGNQLLIKRQAPEGLSLDHLQSLIGSFPIYWGSGNDSNLQRDSSFTQFSTLQLDAASVRRMIGRITVKGSDAVNIESEQRIDGYLFEWLMQSKGQIATLSSNAYHPPELGQLLFLDEEVLKPVIALSNNPRATQEPYFNDELQRIARMAAALNLQLTYYTQPSTRQSYLILGSSRGNKTPQYWGTYIWRLGDAKNFVVQVPRPLAERQTFEYGTTLFERLNARCLMIAGAHAQANADGSADVMSTQHHQSMFNLVHQRMLQAVQPKIQHYVQIRGFANSSLLGEADSVLSYWRNDGREQSALSSQLLQTLRADGSRVKVASGEKDFEGFFQSENAQTELMSIAPEARLAQIWISIHSRDRFSSVDSDSRLAAYFEAVGIPNTRQELGSWIKAHPWQQHCSVTDAMRADLTEFSRSRDVVVLEKIHKTHPSVQLQLVMDVQSGQAFLDIRESPDRWCGLFNVYALNEKSLSLDSKTPVHIQARLFADSRSSWWQAEHVQ